MTPGSAPAAGVVNPRARQRALAIGIEGDETGGEQLAELKELLRTAGVATAGAMVQRRDRPDPASYFGQGKLIELKEAAERADANLIACDDELLPRQERNLEAELGMPVIDRTAIILDIFADHASTAEGKLQVDLARMQYDLARVRGLWTHLQRLGGGIGSSGGMATRGPGEAQIETDRRLARDRITALRRRLATVERNRANMRRRRLESAVPRIALAGYTNAGKSTLMNALTGADVPVGARLFHTLDPTTRSMEHEGRRYLLTDTVGFIRKLPHELVEAFKATLEETVEADLVLHVVDGAAEPDDMAGAIGAVNSVLDEIGAESKRLLVLNKMDLVAGERFADLRLRHPEAIRISAAAGEGIGDLVSRIEAEFAEALRDVEIVVPYERGALLSELYELAPDLEREDLAEGVRVRARVPIALAHRFAASNGAAE